MSNFVARFVKNEDGATAIEYGMIVALMAAIIAGAWATVGTQITSMFGKIASNL